jgi:hypothetical protein
VRLVIVLLLLLLSVPLASAQDTMVISAELEANMQAIEDATSQIRGLEALEPIERHFPTREEVEEYLNTTFDTDLPEEVAWRETQFYIAFDLLPPDTNLRDIYVELLTSQVAGFYDPETKAMNTILLTGDIPEDELPLMEQIVYSHEYTHALQDQHFGLRELGLSAETAQTSPDRLLAIQALVEGDATVVMTFYMQEATADNPFAAFEMLAQGLETGNLFLPSGTPPILAHELLYPYEAGAAFVATLVSEGGWELVNRAYTDNLPESTEQILHPQRYLDGDHPQEVTLQPVELGDDWTLLHDRTMGEFYLREYLLTQLPRRQVVQAAEGWGGDRYQIYYNEQTEELAWMQRIMWDNADEAAQFDDAYDAFGAARFEDGTEESPCWWDNDEALCFVSDDAGSVLAYAPTHEMAKDLLNRQG